MFFMEFQSVSSLRNSPITPTPKDLLLSEALMGSFVSACYSWSLVYTAMWIGREVMPEREEIDLRNSNARSAWRLSQATMFRKLQAGTPQ
jgi:hypothetical protein